MKPTNNEEFDINKIKVPRTIDGTIMEGIYRKRALSIACAIFLMIGSLIPHTAELPKFAEWLLIAFGLVFVLIFGSKFVINSIKK